MRVPRAGAAIAMLWLAGASAALAQAQPEPQPQQQMGGHANGALREACAADAKTFCPGVPRGSGMHQCMRQNFDKLSSGCKEALKAAHSMQGKGPAS
jgi:hypothetical protein